MRHKISLSKTAYMQGLHCPLRLWYSHNPPPNWEREEYSASHQTGIEVGAWARKLYPKGVYLQESDLNKAVEKTQQLTNAGKKVLFEAAAQDPKTGACARADILRRHNNGWHLFEVKSTVSINPEEHIYDIAFQRIVFARAGYPITKCFVMHIDNTYIRQGALNLKKLFVCEEVTSDVLAMEDGILQEIKSFTNILHAAKPPKVDLDSRCFSCEYHSHCWRNCPDYSIYDLFGATTADKVYAEINSMEVKDLPLHLLPKNARKIDLQAHRSGNMQIKKTELQNFLRDVKYPVLHLDYETISPAVPLYDNTSPYQVIPFQFSAQLQIKRGGKLTQHDFLHEEQNDPRPPLIESLRKVAAKSKTIKTIIAYNMSFEKKVHKQLAQNYPHHTNFLEELNARMIDLYKPFKYNNRWLYHPEQMGSASLKDVLPAFCQGMGYSKMAIASGIDASYNYLAFAQGNIPKKEQKDLFRNLRDYCNYDTVATAKLLDKLWSLAE